MVSPATAPPVRPAGTREDSAAVRSDRRLIPGRARPATRRIDHLLTKLESRGRSRAPGTTDFTPPGTDTV
eukprot:758714-Hanusia_phi.AAC.1